GEERRLPTVMLLRGLLQRIRGDYGRALSHYREAIAALRSLHDDDALVRALLWSAQVLRYLRRPREALEQAREAQRLAPEGASSQAAWISHLAGGRHADLGEIEAAAAAHLGAEAMFALLGDVEGELAQAIALAQPHPLL